MRVSAVVLSLSCDTLATSTGEHRVRDQRQSGRNLFPQLRVSNVVVGCESHRVLAHARSGTLQPKGAQRSNALCLGVEVLASRRRPDRTIERSKSADGTQSGAPRLTTSLRWPAASRSFSSIRGVVPPHRPVATSHPQQNDAADRISPGTMARDAVKMPSAKEGPAMHADSIYKRAVWLMSDAVVLTIAAPFFAVWWVGRAVKRMLAPK